jgi:TPR repeat protein
MADRVAALVPQHRADIEREAKNFAPALEHYSAAIALFSTARRLCARSYVLSQLKRDAEAFADVKLALSKSHKHRYCVTRAVGQAAKATDAAQAIQLLSMALEADPRSRAAYNERAWKHQQTGRLDLAFKDYRASAELGDWVGELQVGKFLWSGLGVTQDRETALVWLRKAAAHGDRNAKVSLQQALDVLGRKE